MFGTISSTLIRPSSSSTISIVVETLYSGIVYRLYKNAINKKKKIDNIK